MIFHKQQVSENLITVIVAGTVAETEEQAKGVELIFKLKLS